MKLIVVSILLLAVARQLKAQCTEKFMGRETTVCVCNEKTCDDVGDIVKPEPGYAMVYDTSKDGNRFKRYQQKFVLPDESTERIKIQMPRAKGGQKIIGFGGAFTDAAGINIKKLSPALQDRVIKAYYSTQGLDYNLGRIPIASCDFSTRAYSYDDTDGDFGLENFSLASEDNDFKIPYIIKAKEINPNLYLFGSPWSSPAWMKTNKKMHNGGALLGEPGTEYYKTWANYFVKFIDAYKKEGIDMWGLTVENEPGAGFIPDFKWQSLAFNATMQRDFVKMDLGPALVENGHKDVQLMIHDDQRPTIKTFADTILQDPEAAKYVAGSAVHWYEDEKAGPEVFDEVKNDYPDKFILATEACNGDRADDPEKVSLGNWTRAEKYAHSIIEDLQHSVSGWVDWNLALDLQGGPNWVGNFVDAPIIVNATANEFYLQPMYYVLGHFSKFLPRDSVQSVWGNGDGVEFVSFQRPDKGIVLVILNRNENSRGFQLMDPVNHYLNVDLAGKSIVTIHYYQNE